MLRVLFNFSGMNYKPLMLVKIAEDESTESDDGCRVVASCPVLVILLLVIEGPIGSTYYGSGVKEEPENDIMITWLMTLTH